MYDALPNQGLSPMLRFTIRDWLLVLGAGVAVVLVACTVAAIGWLQNDPWSGSGSLRHGLENVQRGAAERDRQIEQENPN